MSACVSINDRAGAAKARPPLWIVTAPWRKIATYLLRRAAIARLRELDADALRDIGLERSEIEMAAYGLMPVPKEMSVPSVRGGVRLIVENRSYLNDSRGEATRPPCGHGSHWRIPRSGSRPGCSTTRTAAVI